MSINTLENLGKWSEEITFFVARGTSGDPVRWNASEMLGFDLGTTREANSTLGQQKGLISVLITFALTYPESVAERAWKGYLFLYSFYWMKYF